MRAFFITVLVLNLLLEALAGVALILGPEGLLSEARPEGGMWAMNYGFAALAISSAVFWIWPHRDDGRAVGAVLGILVTFHACMSVALAVAGNQLAGMIAHFVMTAFCLLLLTQRNRWCQPSASPSG